MKFLRIIILYAFQLWKKLTESLNFVNALYAKGYLDYKHATYGDGMKVYGRPRLYIGKGSTLRIGRSFICRSGRFTTLDNGAYSSIILFDGAHVEIGDDSGMTNTIIVSKASVTIGNHVNIGNGTIILDSDLHSLDWQERSVRGENLSTNRPIIIGDHVFIGMRSMILKGVTIGEKSVVAAGSVVTHNVPPGEIWGGNPAKKLKSIQQTRPINNP